MKLRIYFILFVSLFSMASCSSLKDLVYFQEKNNTLPPANTISKTTPVHIIAVGDVISLNINTPLQTSSQILNQKEGVGIQVKGDSTIELPILGTIKLAGLTMSVAKDTLLLRAKVYFNEPYVKLQLVSFKVTVLGEVGIPGIKSLNSENATILDAIASSSDLTSFGNRTNIKVIRDSTVYYLNITDMDIFKSDGFYLQSNDIVYVQPLRRKNALTNLSTFTTVFSVSSLLVTISTSIILLTR